MSCCSGGAREPSSAGAHFIGFFTLKRRSAACVSTPCLATTPPPIQPQTPLRKLLLRLMIIRNDNIIRSGLPHNRPLPISRYQHKRKPTLLPVMSTVTSYSSGERGGGSIEGLKLRTIENYNSLGFVGRCWRWGTGFFVCFAFIVFVAVGSPALETR